MATFPILSTVDSGLIIKCKKNLIVNLNDTLCDPSKDFLKKEISKIVANYPHYLYSNEGENPYYAFLAISDIAIVTPDSVNMVSETITANLSTYVFDIKCKSKRINKFLSKLKSENLIKKIDGEINKFEFKEINATKEIANHLVKLI